MPLLCHQYSDGKSREVALWSASVMLQSFIQLSACMPREDGTRASDNPFFRDVRQITA